MTNARDIAHWWEDLAAGAADLCDCMLYTAAASFWYRAARIEARLGRRLRWYETERLHELRPSVKHGRVREY